MKIDKLDKWYRNKSVKHGKDNNAIGIADNYGMV